jgi:Tfp pilus assembly protein PilF
MWYPDSIEARVTTGMAPRLAALLLCVSVAAGCATTGEAPTGGDAVAGGETAVTPAVQADHDRAVMLLEAGDMDGAEVLLDRFVAAHPAYPGAWTNLAIVYRRTDRDDAAAAALEQALAIDPQFAPALNEYGLMHREAGRFGEAEAAYLKAITARPDYALAHFNLGVLNDLYLSDPQAALDHYERYQALTSGGDEMVTLWIADIRRRLGIEARAARAD